MLNGKHRAISSLTTVSTLMIFGISVVFILPPGGSESLSNQAHRQEEKRPTQKSKTVEIDLGKEAVEGEAIVQVKYDGKVNKRLFPFAQRIEGFTSIDSYERLNDDCYLVRSSTLNVRDLVIQLSSLKTLVARAEPNYVISAFETPDDPLLNNLWALDNRGQTIKGVKGIPGADIGAIEAWDISKGSEKIVVAVLDTGISYCHRDLKQNVWSSSNAFGVSVGSTSITIPPTSHGYDFVNSDSDPLDDNGHGSHVSGIIGAEGNNKDGVVGVNWRVSMIALKILDRFRKGTVANAIKAIKFAVELKRRGIADIRVLNNSWGTNGYSQCLFDQIDEAGRNGILFVAAAGNSPRDTDITPVYPASYDLQNIISVAALTNQDSLAYFSNYGKKSVHIGAPGFNILSTIPEDCKEYMSFNGTSQAAPFVSGAAALLLSRQLMGPLELKQLLLSNVVQIPDLQGMTSTGGRLNVNKAIRAIKPNPKKRRRRAFRSRAVR